MKTKKLRITNIIVFLLLIALVGCVGISGLKTNSDSRVTIVPDYYFDFSTANDEDFKRSFSMGNSNGTLGAPEDFYLDEKHHVISAGWRAMPTDTGFRGDHYSIVGVAPNGGAQELLGLLSSDGSFACYGVRVSGTTGNHTLSAWEDSGKGTVFDDIPGINMGAEFFIKNVLTWTNTETQEYHVDVYLSETGDSWTHYGEIKNATRTDNCTGQGIGLHCDATEGKDCGDAYFHSYLKAGTL